MSASLVLGTAQWGSNYGITNYSGRPSDQVLETLIELAVGSGVNRLDTAPKYGDALQRLRPWVQEFCITSKISGGPKTLVQGEIKSTFSTLGVERIDSILVHDWGDLNSETRRHTAIALEEFRAEGLIGRIGVSVYENSEIESAAEIFKHLDMVQVPSNALDQRLLGSRVISELHSQQTLFQVRSAFLQGLLVSKVDTPEGNHPSVVGFHARNLGHQLERALGHVQAIPWADEIIIGVASATELEEILRVWETCSKTLEPRENAGEDPLLIDPRFWKGNYRSEMEK